MVSPDPDVSVMTIEPGRHRCLILGSDGLWNMLSPAEAVSVVTDLEMHFEDRVIHDPVSAIVPMGKFIWQQLKAQLNLKNITLIIH